MSNLAGVVRLLKKEQDRLTKELRGIGAALAAFGKTYRKGTGTRTLFKSARARIAAELGLVVRIAQLLIQLPFGSFQRSHSPAKANNSPLLTSKQYGCFAFPTRTHS